MEPPKVGDWRNEDVSPGWIEGDLEIRLIGGHQGCSIQLTGKITFQSL